TTRKEGKEYAVRLWDTDGLPFTQDHPQPVRVVWSQETLTQNHYRRGQRVSETTEQQWLWVTTLDRKIFSGLQVRQLGHDRWKLENNGWNDLTQNWALKHDFLHACKHRPKIVLPSGERQLAPNRGLAAVTLILCLAFALSSAFILLHSKIFRRYGLSYLIWKSGANFTAPCGKTHPASALLPDHHHCFLATSEFPFALPSRRTRQRVSAASCPASSPASASRKPPCESAPCGTEPTQRTVFSDLAGAMRSSWHFDGCAGLQGMIGLNLSRTNM